MIDIGDDCRSKPATAVLFDYPTSQKAGLFFPGVIQVQVYNLNLFSGNKWTNDTLGRIFCIQRYFFSQGRN